MIDNYSIIYSGKYNSEKIITVKRSTKNEAKILAKALRKAGYDVDVWEYYDNETKLTNI